MSRVAIIGGSLGGLATANVLTNLGFDVTVYEKASEGYSHRGACLGFVDVEQLERVAGRPFCRNGRRASLDQGAFFYGDVWSFLYSSLPAGCVKFGHTVDDIGDDPNKPTIDGQVFDLVVISDGGFSTLRDRYIDSKAAPDYSGHQIIWASVDASNVPGGLSSFDAEFGSTETATYTSREIYDAVILDAPKNDGSHMYACGFFIATPESEIRRPDRGDNRQVAASTRTWATEPDWFLPLIRKLFSGHAGGQIVRFTEAASRCGKISPNPVFEYAAPTAVKGRAVLIGDAAHLSTPWTAAGAHTAILDAVALGEALCGKAPAITDRALQRYNKGGVRRAQALLRQSKACSRRLVPRKGGKHAAPSPASLVAEEVRASVAAAAVAAGPAALSAPLAAEAKQVES